MYNLEFADATTLRDGPPGRHVLIGIDMAQRESTAAVRQSIFFASLLNQVFTPTPEIEQATNSTSFYHKFLEAAGWTELQDVNLCSGRETWGIPPGGVCPRKVMPEDITEWSKEKVFNVLVLTKQALNEASFAMRPSAESIRLFGTAVSELPEEGGEDA
jgi:hypothetical protein